MAKFMDEGAEEGMLVFVEFVDEILATFGAGHLFSHAIKYPNDLLVEFISIRDDEDAAVVDVFPYPLGEPNHAEALAAALCMPDNAAFPIPDKEATGLYAKKLMRPADFFYASIKEDKVMDDLQKALFMTGHG